MSKDTHTEKKKRNFPNQKQRNEGKRERGERKEREEKKITLLLYFFPIYRENKTTKNLSI